MLPSALNLGQRWRKYLLHRNVKKQEQSLFRVNHFHAASLLHRAVKSLMLRDDLRQQVVKFAARSHEAEAAITPVDKFEDEHRDSDSDDSSDLSNFYKLN